MKDMTVEIRSFKTHSGLASLSLRATRGCSQRRLKFKEGMME